LPKTYTPRLFFTLFSVLIFTALACGNNSEPAPTVVPLPTFTPVPPTPVLPATPEPAPRPVTDLAEPLTIRNLPSFADVVEQIQPWVVSITTERFVRGFFSTFRDEGAGSGFIVRPNGYVVTNEHVIRGAQQIQVHLPNGETFPADFVGADTVTDIAILKIDADGLPFATLADGDKIRVGDWVMTMGNALALKGGPTVTLGIVSGVGRTIETDQAQQFFDLIQTDATINTGNSGGPLVDLNGNVVGINQAVLAEARFGFAINSAVAAPVIASLIENGRVSRPNIGINGDDVTAAIARSFNLPITEGVIVTTMQLGGPAHAAGIRVGDIISKVDDIPTPDLANLQRRLWSYHPGDEVVVEYINEGTTEIATVTLGEDR